MRSHAFPMSTQRIQYWFLYPRHRLLQIHARLPSDNHSDNKVFQKHCSHIDLHSCSIHASWRHRNAVEFCLLYDCGLSKPFLPTF